MGPRVCELKLTQFMGLEPEGLEREKNGVLTPFAGCFWAFGYGCRVFL